MKSKNILGYRTKAEAVKAASQFRAKFFPTRGLFSYDVWKNFSRLNPNSQFTDPLWFWALKSGPIFIIQADKTYAFIKLSKYIIKPYKEDYHAWVKIYDWHHEISNYYRTYQYFIMRYSESPVLALRKVTQEYKIYSTMIKTEIDNNILLINKIISQ